MADAGTGAGILAMAAASITVATIQADATRDAAHIQTASADRTADLIDKRWLLMRDDFEKYRDIGLAATDQLNTRLNEFTSTSNPYAAAMDAEMPIVPAAMAQDILEATPGYQFTLAQGLRATQNTFAARGLGVSGAAMRAAADYATALSDQTFNTRFAQQQALFGNQQQRFADIQAKAALEQGMVANGYNRLRSVVTLGQNSAAQVGNAGVESANQAGKALMAGAEGAAAGVLAGAGAISGGVNGVANAFNSYQQQKAYGLNGSQVSSGEKSWASDNGYTMAGKNTYITTEMGA